MHPLLNVADKAARRAGDIILRGLARRDLLSIEEKDRNDFVTDIDKKAEKDIIETIRKHYPHHAILGEESGNIEASGYDDIQWIIDPLDGTTNFIHGFPHFAVSIAIRVKGRIEHGLIYDPFKQEVFSASRGEGALLNQRRIRVSGKAELSGALLASGLSFRSHEQFALQIKLVHALSFAAGDLRRTGSAALDLAYVASGRLDGYWEMGIKIWDIAAGVLMVKESGGLVSDFVGEEKHLESGRIVAATPKVFKHMLQTIKPIL